MNAESESNSRESERPRRELIDLRDALVHLHKALIDSERISYERTFGTVNSPGDFLQLLIRDPWFGWLHPLSELIVSMDETLDEAEPVSSESFEAYRKTSRALLTPSETGEGFSTHYFEALQRDPDVVMAHARAIKVGV